MPTLTNQKHDTHVPNDVIVNVKAAFSQDAEAKKIVGSIFELLRKSANGLDSKTFQNFVDVSLSDIPQEQREGATYFRNCVATIKWALDHNALKDSKGKDRGKTAIEAERKKVRDSERKAKQDAEQAILVEAKMGGEDEHVKITLIDPKTNQPVRMSITKELNAWFHAQALGNAADQKGTVAKIRKVA